jgi:hypothetical protein
MIPDEIQKQYNILDIVHDGYIYAKIRKGMYGLPQAGILANKLLVKRLALHMDMKTRPLFSLIVDNFGFKYVGKEHTDHLIDTLQLYYPLSTN